MSKVQGKTGYSRRYSLMHGIKKRVMLRLR